MRWGRLLPLWASLALLLQGVALPAPREEAQAGLAAKGGVLALKEERSGGSLPSLLATSPKPPRALPRPLGEGPALALPPPPPSPTLYLLYRRLQLEGG
ncbi:hypothetical protein [Thermus igniterrae]|uniref:hypothetical protein n=1 Tax=Thermus igniterrae TaxID=88189 RepID=UPI000377FB14|nr:hypothetical protein [Thermus igniterrae]